MAFVIRVGTFYLTSLVQPIVVGPLLAAKQYPTQEAAAVDANWLAANTFIPEIVEVE